jgi:hypothetical protein
MVFEESDIHTPFKDLAFKKEQKMLKYRHL